MSSKLIDTLVTAIRGRSERPENPQTRAASGVPCAGDGKVRRREARFSDFDEVADLKKRMGLSPDTPENWQRLWQDNPALRACGKLPPIGWILEAEGRVVGYLGNITLRYRYEHRELMATTASAFAVEPEYRGWGAGLMASFYRQGGIDLFLNTSAIPAVGKIAIALKAQPLPQEDYHTALFWVLDPYGFSKAVMRKLGVRPGLLRLGGVAGFLALSAERAVRARRPGRTARDLTVEEIGLEGIGDEFQDLWVRKSKEDRRLLAVRTPEILRWHFLFPGSAQPASILCCRSAERLIGYLVVRSATNSRTGLRTTSVADLFVEKDDPIAIQHLLLAAYQKAKEAKSHILEVLGFPKSIRNVCLQGRPYSRSYPACPFYYHAADGELREFLRAEVNWYACPFDGDTSLAL